MNRQKDTPAPGLAAFLELSATYLGLDTAGHRTGRGRGRWMPGERRLTSTIALGYPARERYLRCEHQRSPGLQQA